MAEKKTKTKASSKRASRTSKKAVRTRATTSKHSPSKAKTRPAAESKTTEAPIKRKPTSITITRPEATRAPIAALPQPKLEAPVGAPSILVPKDGLPVDTLTPVLRWMHVGGATRYEVEWSHDTHFGRGHSSTLVSLQTAISLDASHALKGGYLYRWRVRGGNDVGWGPWSGVASFRVPDQS